MKIKWCSKVRTYDQHSPTVKYRVVGEWNNNDGTAEPRRLQLVITNEGLIDLHKLHRFQTNLLYPVHLDYIPSDRGQTNRASALMQDKILA